MTRRRRTLVLWSIPLLLAAGLAAFFFFFNRPYGASDGGSGAGEGFVGPVQGVIGSGAGEG